MLGMDEMAVSAVGADSQRSGGGRQDSILVGALWDGMGMNMGIWREGGGLRVGTGLGCREQGSDLRVAIFARRHCSSSSRHTASRAKSFMLLLCF